MPFAQSRINAAASTGGTHATHRHNSTITVMPPKSILFSAEQCLPKSGPGYEYQIAEQMNRYWDYFEPYADTSFVRKGRDSMADLLKFSDPGPERSSAFDALHRQWWEMFVGCLMLESGIALVPRCDWKKEWGTAGPDLQAKLGDKTVWVECISPDAGNSKDAVPEPEIPVWNATAVDEHKPVSQHLPSREIMLRFTGAIRDKRKQYASHRSSGIIGPNDAYVIAVNGRCVSPLITIGERGLIPSIAKVVFGLGDISITYNPNVKSSTEQRVNRQTALQRSNGAPVSTNIFADGSAAEVSGVLYSSIDSANVGSNPHAEFLYVANPTAANPLPARWIPQIRVCTMFTSADGTSVLECEPPDVTG